MINIYLKSFISINENTAITSGRTIFESEHIYNPEFIVALVLIDTNPTKLNTDNILLWYNDNIYLMKGYISTCERQWQPVSRMRIGIICSVSNIKILVKYYKV